MHKVLAGSVIVLSTLFLAAYSGGGHEPPAGGLSLAIQDAPVDGADALNITLSRIDLHRQGETISYALDADPDTAGKQPWTVNLMDYQGSDRLQLLKSVRVPAGTYDWIELHVDDAEIVFDAATASEVTYRLDIPSNTRSGFRLKRDINVTEGGITDLTIDLDLRQSVTQESPGYYTLRPHARLIDTPRSGIIAGSVKMADARQACAVYVYPAGATPDDICRDLNGQACEGTTNPITSALPDCGAGLACRYATALLQAGEYQVAKACFAPGKTSDDPMRDENPDFSATRLAVVTAGQTTRIDL